MSFATLMATLECAKEEKSTANVTDEQETVENSEQRKENVVEKICDYRPSIFKKRVVAASIGFVVLNIAAFGINSLLKSTR